jgi:hypothetical protein
MRPLSKLRTLTLTVALASVSARAVSGSIPA